MNLNKSLKLVIFALVILEIILSGWLVYKNLTTADVCIIGDSCNGVQNSDFGEIFGVKLSYLGLFAFIALLITYFIQKRVFLIATSIGSAVSVYLMSVQLFVLKEVCVNCIIIDGIMILIGVVSVIWFSRNKNKESTIV